MLASVRRRRSIAIGSHSPFNDWGCFLSDQPTAASLLYRLWQLADRVLPAFARYRETAGQAGRSIPILRLTPQRLT